MLAAQLVDQLRRLDRPDRVPVVRALLRMSGGDVEQRVVQHEQHLLAAGVDPVDALVDAFDYVLQRAGGGRILHALAVAGAAGAVQQGKVTPSRHAEAADKFERTLVRLEGVSERDLIAADPPLGFISEAINLGTQILSFGIGAIKQAVHKARNKRRAYKRMMTPLTDEEIAAVAGQAAVQAATWDEALPLVIEELFVLRKRRDFILQPKDETEAKRAKKAVGADVNEFYTLKKTYKYLRKAVEQRLREEAKQKKTRNEAVIAGVGALAAVGLLVGVWYAVK